MKKFLKWLVIGWTAFWILLFLVIIIAVLVREPVKRDSILRITFEGPLREASGPSFSSLFAPKLPSLRELSWSIRTAATDERIKGLLLEVREPEVSVAQVQEIEEAMKVFRASGKWNLAYLETAGEVGPGDGIYGLAATAERIMLAPSGEVNLAGLRVIVPFLKGTLGKLEIQPYFDKRYQYKTAPNTFTEAGFTPAHRESIVALADDLQLSLNEHLAARRGKKSEEIKAWVDAGPHFAEEAKTLGMVDSLGYWDAVVSEADKVAGREESFVDASTYASAVAQGKGGPTIAVIIGAGTIHRGDQDSGLPRDAESAGSQTLIEAFREARRAKVKAVVFRIDSPGGSYVASDLIRAEVASTRAAGIPVVASMGSYAASGGYFIAMDADRIIADPGTITGSIGVYGGAFATRAFFEHFLGVTFGMYKTMPEGDHFGVGVDPPTDKEKKDLARVLDGIYRDFVDKAAKARKKSPDELHKVAQGRVWSGMAALKQGLIDELGGIDTAIARAKELAKIPPASNITLKEYPQPETPLAVLARVLDPGASSSLGVKLPKPLRAMARGFERATMEPGESTLLFPAEISF